MRELEFGNGKVLVASIADDDGRIGIVLRPVDDPREIDKTEPDWKDNEPFETQDNDVILWFKNLEGARVMQDRMNIATLQLNKFKVTDVGA